MMSNIALKSSFLSNTGTRGISATAIVLHGFIGRGGGNNFMSHAFMMLLVQDIM